MIGRDLVGKLIAVGAGIAIVVAGYFYWEGRVEQVGYDRATAQWVEKERQITEKVQSTYTKKLQAAMDKTKTLQAEATQREAARIEQEKEHEKAVDTAVARALAGAERLSIRTKPAACPAAGGASGPAGAALGPAEPEERADLLPETAAELIRIGAAAARDVRDFNDLLDEYHALDAACR